MKTLSHIFTKLATGVLLLAGFGIIAPGARAQALLAKPTPSLTDFDLIAQRNIFDPNRGTAAAPTQPVATRRQPVVETFSFRGAAEKVGKGFDAFFIGYGTPTAGVVEVNDVINGFKVVEIGLHEVRLVEVSKNDVVILTDETGLKREDGGAWAKVAAPTFPAPTVAMRGRPGWSGARLHTREGEEN
jgi:hypothetical protein